MRSYIKDNRGITLVELVIGMGLLSIVIALAYSLYFFGTTSFQTGANRVDLQQNARLMADFITEEIRLAIKVDILAEAPESLDAQYHYIYLEGNTVKHSVSGATAVEKFSAISRKVDFDLEFLKSSDEIDEILEFTVTARYGDRDYAVKTEVLILNMQGSSIIGVTPGFVVYYNYPPELD